MFSNFFSPKKKIDVPQRIDYQPGTLVDGKYTIEKSLGEGAFGQVYKVKDTAGTTLAFKLLRLWDVPNEIRQTLIDRFDMEFQTGRIESNYLVHSLDHGLVQGNPYIVMEFCSGGDLASKIGKLGSPEISKISREILHGLNDLHNNGKVHRDLKPENVLFREDGTAVLADFGISGDRNNRMTSRNIFGRPDQIFGTYAYMPPEQVNRAGRDATVLPTTDIFSFGVMLYQLLTGVLPFGKLEDENDLVRYQKRGKTGDWDKLPLLNVAGGESWVSVIDGCLKPDFKNRLQKADAVILKIPNYEQSHSSASVPYAGKSFVNPWQISQNHKITKAVFRVMQGENYGEVFDLVELIGKHDLILTIGRQDINHICLKETRSSYISRFHCTLESDPDGVHWNLRDGQFRRELGEWVASSNGTFVNSLQISSSGFWLASGDIITIGETKLRFELS